MQLPEDLQTWTFETVRDIVRASEFEPAAYDYKEVLTPEGKDANKFNKAL